MQVQTPHDPGEHTKVCSQVAAMEAEHADRLS